MSKAENPILKTLAAEEAKLAQAKAEMAEFQRKLCDLVREAGLSNIEIRPEGRNEETATTLRVVSPTGPAYFYERANFRDHEGDIFQSPMSIDVLHFLKRIVRDLEAGTARVSKGFRR